MTEQDHYGEIYRNKADDYERLIDREDHEGNLLRNIREIVDLNKDLEVIDSGAGTGRLTGLLAPLVKSVRAFDLSPAMLKVAEEKLKRSIPNSSNWTLAEADHRRIPAPDRSADFVIAGWAFCYLSETGPNWREEVQKGLDEFSRLLKDPNGRIIIIETLGTGYEEPHRLPALEPYFQFLESKGFKSLSVRTDYKFRDIAEARELTKFFFGDEVEKKVIDNNWVILPECTGIWYL